MTGRASHVVLVNNRHPMVPLSTLRAGFRLVLHRLSTELLHALLVKQKVIHAAATAAPSQTAPHDS